MAALDFPSSPSLYQIYTANTKSWYWDGTTWLYLPQGTSPPVVDPNFNKVVGLYHNYGNAAANSTGQIVDYSNKGNHLAITNIGTSLTTNTKFGSSCIQSFGGGWGGHAINATDFSLGTGDFTIECWINFANTTSFTNLLDFRPTDSVTSGPIFIRNGSGKLAFLATGSVSNITSTTTPTASVWHHVHVTRASGTTYMGLDGTQQGSDYTDSNNYTGGHLWFMQDANTAIQSLYGSWQEARITKGFARYTRTYSVPTELFPNYLTSALPPVAPDPFFSSVKGLWHLDSVNGSNQFIDSSSVNHPLTIAGSIATVLSNARTKFRPYSLFSNNSGGHADFIGSADFTLGTGDFCIEGWFYPTGIGGYQGIIVSENSANPFFRLYASFAGNQKLTLVTGSGAGTANPTGTTTVTNNVWHHFIWSRISGTSRLGMDGIQEGSNFTDSQNYNGVNVYLANGESGGSQYFPGYLSDIRLTKGSGRGYTGGAYTVPTTTFPDA